MKGSNSSSSGVVVPRWYPDGTGGSASFTDVGCGLESGSAHCDFAELEACLVSRYTRSRALPPPRSLLGGGGGGARQYVTVLRSPLSRVRSEFAFACQTKRRTRRPDRLINTPHGPRALLDWSPRLWGSLDERTCAAPSAAAAYPRLVAVATSLGFQSLGLPGSVEARQAHAFGKAQRRCIH